MEMEIYQKIIVLSFSLLSPSFFLPVHGVPEKKIVIKIEMIIKF